MLRNHGDAIRKLGEDFRAAADDPAPGEQFVLKSFSTEWRDYDDSEALWTWSIEERRAFFLEEIGAAELTGAERTFVEIGCGLGLVTSLAAAELGLDAIGVDLSLAAMRATQRYRTNPLAHFIQASLWALPFRRSSFDIVYSHGVLHHTHDTERAFSGVAALARPGGRTYVWVYGPGRARAIAAASPGVSDRGGGAPDSGAPACPAGQHRSLSDRARLLGLEPLAQGARPAFASATTSSGRCTRRAIASRRHSPTSTRPMRCGSGSRDAGFSRLHVLREEEVEPASRESVAQSVAIRGVRSVAEASTSAIDHSVRQRGRALTKLEVRRLVQGSALSPVAGAVSSSGPRDRHCRAGTTDPRGAGREEGSGRRQAPAMGPAALQYLQ